MFLRKYAIEDSDSVVALRAVIESEHLAAGSSIVGVPIGALDGGVVSMLMFSSKNCNASSIMEAFKSSSAASSSCRRPCERKPIQFARSDSKKRNHRTHRLHILSRTDTPIGMSVNELSGLTNTALDGERCAKSLKRRITICERYILLYRVEEKICCRIR